MCYCLCSVFVCGMMMKGREKVKPGALAHSLLFSKSTKGAARFNVPIQRTNRSRKYYMPSQHTYWKRRPDGLNSASINKAIIILRKGLEFKPGL